MTIRQASTIWLSQSVISVILKGSFLGWNLSSSTSRSSMVHALSSPFLVLCRVHQEMVCSAECQSCEVKDPTVASSSRCLVFSHTVASSVEMRIESLEINARCGCSFLGSMGTHRHDGSICVAANVDGRVVVKSDRLASRFILDSIILRALTNRCSIVD